LSTFKIAELKDDIESDAMDGEETGMDPSTLELEGPELFFGKNKNATKEELLAAIPTRPAVDRLISRYFKTMDMAPGRRPI
jgi:hypothetical protein